MKTWMLLLAGLCGLISLLAGCGASKTPAADRGVNDGCPCESDAVVQLETLEGRGWPESVVPEQIGGIEHKVVYLNNRPESLKAMSDQDFDSWTKSDLKSFVRGPIRFCGQIVLLPVSVVRERPWQDEVSRGHLPVYGLYYEYPDTPADIEQVREETAGY